MKKSLVLMLILTALLLALTAAYADGGSCGANTTWSLENGVLTISGSGRMNSYSSVSEIPWYSENDSTTRIVIGSGVTYVKAYAFRFCASEVIVLQGGQAQYDEMAKDEYFNTSGLGASYKEIVLNTGTIAGGVTWDLSRTGKLYISGSGAVPDYESVSDVPWYSLYSSIASAEIKGGVTGIGSNAFKDCTGMTGVDVSGSVTAIGASAFAGCTGLTKVTLSDCMTTIGASAFEGCTGLTNITIPGSVETIGASAFSGSNLSRVTFGSGSKLSSIGNNAFASGVMFSCDSPSEALINVLGKDNIYTATGKCGDNGDNVIYGLTAGNRLIIRGNGAFSSTTFRDGGHMTIESIIIEEGVTALCDYAFFGCRDLTTVSVAASVQSIGVYAFKNCEKLNSVTFADHSTLTTIGNYAFTDCDSLKSIKIPDSVTSFAYDSMLAYKTKIYCDNPSAELQKDTNYRSVIIVVQGRCGGTDESPVKYSLKANGYLTFTGEGSMQDYSSASPAPWYGKSILAHIDFGYRLSSIGAFAFKDCTNLTDAEIPGNITAIGASAFQGCTQLASIAISAGVETIGENAFQDISDEAIIKYGSCKRSTFVECPNVDVVYAEHQWNEDTGRCQVCDSSEQEDTTSGYCGKNVKWALADGTLTISGTGAMVNYKNENYVPWSPKCKLITKVIIESGVTSIGSFAFYWLENLTTVILPTGLESIGTGAFGRCDKLARIDLPAGLQSIGANAFSSCEKLARIDLPDGLKSIGESAFCCCYGLTGISIPGSVTSFGKSAFSQCTSLTSVTIPEGVTSIGQSAFYYCTTLKNVSIPGSVTSIGEEAFAGCLALDGITISDGVTSIGKNAFVNCSALKSIIIPDSVTDIGDKAFFQCTGLTSVTLPGKLTSLPDQLFLGCTSLKSIIIPDSVTGIGNSTFMNCTGLESIIIPDSVKSIDGTVFQGCTGLAEITVPGSINSINITWVDKCTSLKKIYFLGGDVTKLGNLGYRDDLDVVIARGSCGANVTYELTNQGKLTIWGSGMMADYTRTSAPWNDIKSSIQSVVVSSGITKIGDNAFYGCANLTRVTFAAGSKLAGIGTDAFDSRVKFYCTNPSDSLIKTLGIDRLLITSGTCGGTEESPLTYVLTAAGKLVISGSGAMQDYTSASDVPWYKYRASVTSAEIGSGVTSIGQYSFYETGLTGITIPENVTDINTFAFAKSRLTGITISANTMINGNVFADCSSSLVISIGGKCGADVTYTLTQNDTITISGTGAMTDYTASSPAPWYRLKKDMITKVVINQGVSAIGAYAFAGCSSLSSVSISDSVSGIGSHAFFSIPYFIQISIPQSVNSIGEYALGYNSETQPTTGFVIKGYIDSAAAVYAANNKIWFTPVKYPDTMSILVLPSSLKKIEAGSLYGTGAELIEIPARCSLIAEDAFDGCASLKMILNKSSIAITAPQGVLVLKVR